MSEQENPSRFFDAVMSGAALLDEKRPYWFTEINESRLVMSNASLCILGQLFGDFELGLDQLGLGFSASRLYGGSHGFTVIPSLGIPLDKQFDLLTVAWKQAIRERLEVRAYYVWLNNGRQGSPDDNWYMAANSPAHQSVNPFFD